MKSGWSRALVVFAMASVVAYAHCFSDCSFAPEVHKAPPKSCHHQEPSGDETAPCARQHADLAGPEAPVHSDFASHFSVCAVLPQAEDFTGIVALPGVRQYVSTGSPPGPAFLRSISILRI